MVKIRQAILVEGRYDKNTLSQIVDAPILESSGFGIFKDKKQMRLLRQVAQSLDMTVAQLAIAFMRDQPGITSLVLGADAPEQVTENLACFETPGLDEETTALLRKEFSQVNIPAIMQVLSRPKK